MLMWEQKQSHPLLSIFTQKQKVFGGKAIKRKEQRQNFNFIQSIYEKVENWYYFNLGPFLVN